MAIGLDLNHPADYHARTMHADTDVCKICPEHPEIVILATYSLVKTPAHDGNSMVHRRSGTIRTLSVDPCFTQDFPGHRMPYHAVRKLPAAVLDVQFHPQDGTLFGVALSNASIHFFRLEKRAGVLSRRVVTEFLPLGHIDVTGEDQSAEDVLVTQFRWYDTYAQCGSAYQYTDCMTVALAASLSTGDIISIKAKLPCVRTTYDARLSRTPPSVLFELETIQSHDLEAWTVAIVPISTDKLTFTGLLLSGGDDSKVLTSTLSVHTTGEHSLILLPDHI
jgi:hypothetical protein